MKRVLVIAPHPDDETLGLGGTISKLSDQGYEVSVLVISGHLPPLYQQSDYDKTIREAALAFKVLGVVNYKFLEIPATMIGDLPIHELNKMVFKVIEDIKPHMVFCPYPDRHIDHRLVFDSAMVATRPVGIGQKIEVVAAYETLSETHWNAPHIEPNFTPNWVFDITDFIELKIKALKCYESQIFEFPSPRSIEAIEGLAKFRGTQAGFGFGEALHIIRQVS
jgi:N-acetylglucosamine malate deacetylase 1